MSINKIIFEIIFLKNTCLNGLGALKNVPSPCQRVDSNAAFLFERQIRAFTSIFRLSYCKKSILSIKTVESETKLL